MPVCAVPTCATTHRTTDKTLYKFPKDAKFARIWGRCCMKRDSFNTKCAFICSSHFAEEAYQRDINHEMLGYSSKKNLKRDAVPTLQLPSMRMVRENSIESDGFECISLLVSVSPPLSAKNILKSIPFDLISSPRSLKSRIRFHHIRDFMHTKHRDNSMSLDQSIDTSFDLSSKEHAESSHKVETTSVEANKISDNKEDDKSTS